VAEPLEPAATGQPSVVHAVDDADGLADLGRAPLKIVTLEDLQQAAHQAAADSGPEATPAGTPDEDGTGRLVELDGDHG
jgi:hypothetical protein